MTFSGGIEMEHCTKMNQGFTKQIFSGLRFWPEEDGFFQFPS